jgi:hypothetical protein
MESKKCNCGANIKNKRYNVCYNCTHGRTGRVLCNYCNVTFNTFPHEAEWKTVCTRCYKKVAIQCTDCDKSILPTNDWKTRCGRCNTKYKNMQSSLNERNCLIEKLNTGLSQHDHMKYMNNKAPYIHIESHPKVTITKIGQNKCNYFNL